MNNLQIMSDKAAIGLSVVCTVHCLAMPLALVLLPAITALSLNDEAFHLWMLIAMLPFSAYGLTMGCRKHGLYRTLSVGGIGLLLLAVVSFGGHEMFGEALEKTLTIIGAGTIALAHFWNYRLCQKQENCGCPKPHDLAD